METQRKKERDGGRESFSETGMETGEREEGERAHQAKRSAVAVYFPMPS